MRTQTKKDAPQKVHPAYGRVFIALAVMTLLEVGASYLPVPYKIPVLVILAATKATLVLLFFMHLKYDRPIFAAPFIIALVLLIPIVLIIGVVMPLLY